MFPRTQKLVFNFGVPIKFFSFIGVHQAQIFGCACLKRKWLVNTNKYQNRSKWYLKKANGQKSPQELEEDPCHY